VTCWVDSSLRPFASATLLFAILTTVIAAPNRSNAQAIYYRSIPLGDRAIGLGGAFTGIANDPSATYYNPAGIVTGGRFQLLGSLTSLVFTRQTVDNGFESPNGSENFKSTGTTTLPSFVGTVIKFGRKRFGDHQFALAYSTFEVSREAFSDGASDITETGSLDLRLSDSFRSRWYGFTFAAQTTKTVAVGFSAFLAQQRGSYDEDIGLAGGGTIDENGQRVGGDFGTTSASIRTRTYHILFRLGALYRINPRWQIGFMFQPPAIPVSQKGSVFRRTDSAISGGDTTYSLFDEGDLSTKAPIPFELRTGFEFRANSLTVLSVDAAVSGPIRDRAVFDRPSQLEGLQGNLGIYFNSSTERRWTPNVAIGAEHMFGKAVVAGGLFTNISAAPDVPATATEYSADQVSMFGASVSVGVDTKGYRLGVGATGYFGRGDALAFTIDRGAQVVGYRRTKSTVSALVLYIAGAVSVASKGAKDVQGKLKKKKRKEKQKGEHDGKPDDDDDPDEQANGSVSENESESESANGPENEPENANPPPDANESSPSVE